MDLHMRDDVLTKKINNYFETSKPEEILTEASYFRSHYSPATLINDWCVKRARNEPQIITSEPFITEQMDQFRKLCKMPLPDRKAASDALYKSHGLGQEILLDHLGQTYYDNYSTTYDLFFNHLTKGVRGPYLRKYYKGSYLPERDLTLVYGNLTQWGLKEQVYDRSKVKYCKETPPKSEFSSEYVSYDISVVKKMNEFPSFKKAKKAI